MSNKKDNKLFDQLSGISDMLDGKSQIIPIISPDDDDAPHEASLPDVLPILKQNRSEYFVFVGNDPHAVEVMQAMQRPADKIAFGFQNLSLIHI